MSEQSGAFIPLSEVFVGKPPVPPGITLVDGCPKEPELLPLLHKAVAEGKFTLLGCVSVVVNDEEAVKRQLTRTSVDGHPTCDYETVRRRVAAHNAQTEPVTASLAQTYGHEIVSGEWTFPVVAEDFMCALGRRMLSHVELEGQTTGA